MTPTLHERLDSVIRSLTDVVLPSLPSNSGLAQEQVMLSVRHLQIAIEQLDATPAFEREELADAVALGSALGSVCHGGTQTRGAATALQAAVQAATPAAEPRAAVAAIHQAVARVITAVAADGDAAARPAVRRVVLQHEQARVTKDRSWFKPFGFDVY